MNLDFINKLVNFSRYSGLLFNRLITDTLQINIYRYLSVLVNITHKITLYLVEQQNRKLVYIITCSF